MPELETKYVAHIFVEAPHHQRRGSKPIQKPSEGIHQTNFDGAAKGNPREAETGGLFRDDRGKTLRFYAMTVET